jgi:hypothetical protein
MCKQLQWQYQFNGKYILNLLLKLTLQLTLNIDLLHFKNYKLWY